MKKINKCLVVFILQLIFIVIFFNPEVKALNFFGNYSYTYFNYEQINKGVNFYRDILANGGWEKITAKQELKVGDYGEEIKLLKKRLIKTNDLKSKDINDIFLYDEKLKNAVSLFQYRHGLNTTGKVDSITLKALNITVEEKIKQIETNINRMEKYINNLPQKYIIVNIPDFQLQLIEKNEKIMSMKVIVGSKQNKTPILKSNISHLVLNPTWVIPYNTFVVTILPKIIKDNNYIVNNNIVVFNGWGNNATEIDPDEINWSTIQVKNSSYRFEQKAGPENSMGIAKFKFPNNYNISLHGTPHQFLFNENIRAFSRGCVRLEKPIELAQSILKNTSPEKVVEIVKSGETKRINLSKPLPLFLVYWTAWADQKNRLHFRENIYDY